MLMLGCKGLITFFYYIKQTDSMFPWVCTVIDHRRYPNAMTTSVTPLATLCVPLFEHVLTSSAIYY